ncbi:MAG: tyrosine-type recombinase/integrase [Cyclobacteriaceae bacterium]|nr:tyrosine-type recombinase/integrase [Cyclobacteriaceae bacterium]
MLAKSVTVKRIHHREMNCLALFFPKDREVIDHVKKIPGIKFSATHTCWYIPETPDSLTTIFDTLKGKVWLNYSAVSRIREKKAEIKQSVAEPVFAEPSTAPALVEPVVHNTYEDTRKEALEQMRKKLKLKNYSPSTIKTYTEQFKLFLQFFPESHPQELDEDEILHYMMHLIENKKLSVSAQNQAINAIKFYYEKMLKQDRKVYDLERPLKEKKLPEVLSQEEVMAIFEATGNLKHRTMLMILYASGLRRSELLNLRIGDVDFHRNIVLVRGGKGRKDRHSVMAQSLMPLVEQYLAEYKPKFWLFEGVTGEQYSAGSLQQVLKRAVYKAGIRKNVRLHMLRHSFATHLLESGTSTRYIQVLLGHDSPKTTEIYAQVTRFGLDKVMSPLDHLAITKQLRGDDD